LVACSKAYAYLISLASLNALQIRDIPTVNPEKCAN
jgi:hypothetical protein